MSDSSSLRVCPNCGSPRYRLRYVEPPFQVVTCRQCGLTYLGNPPDEAHLYDTYYPEAERAAADYRADSPYPELAERYAINQQRMNWLKRWKPNGTLLDIGCGQGHFLRTAGEHGYSASGMDVSESAVEYAVREFGVRASVGEIENLLTDGTQYDLITLWHVLEHFVNPFETLRQVRGLLRDGGRCFIEVPNLHSLKFMLAKQKWEGTNHPHYHRTFFSAATLRRALRDTGFSEIERARLSYRIPGRNTLYETSKQILNVAALDAFLDFSARK